MLGCDESVYYGKNSCYETSESQIPKKDFEKETEVHSEEYPKGLEFYNKIKYLLIQLVVVGIVPVCKPGPGFKWRFLLVFLYCVTVYSAWSTFIFFEFKKVFTEIKDSKSLVTFVNSISRFLFLSQHISILFCIWPQAYYIIRNVHHWSEYQDQYENVTQRPFKLTKLNLILKVSFVLLLTINPISFIYYQQSKTRANFIEILFFVYTNHTALVILQLWCFTARLGEVAAEDFLCQLKQTFSKSPTPKDMQDYRLLWLKLSKIVCEAGSMYSMPIAQLTIMMFISIVIYTYVGVISIITSLQSNNIKNVAIVRCCVTDTCVVLCLFVICQKGYSVAKQNQLVKRYLMDLKLPLPLLTQTMISELRIFMRSLDTFPLEFSVRGFQLINKAMLLGFVGDVVTYVIILVQFNISLHHDHPDTKLSFNNNTGIYH